MIANYFIIIATAKLHYYKKNIKKKHLQRWEDCVERDVRRAEEEEKWREKANNTDQWKQLTRVAVQRSDN